MGEFFGESDTAKSVHSKKIICLPQRHLGHSARSYSKVELHLEVDGKEVMCTSILGVALTHSDDGVG